MPRSLPAEMRHALRDHMILINLPLERQQETILWQWEIHDGDDVIPSVNVLLNTGNVFAAQL